MPIIFVVVEIETKETRRWFLNFCLRILVVLKPTNGCSLGLQQVFMEFPTPIKHKFCLRHLYNNFKKKFSGGLMLKDLMMGAAKATYEHLWKQKIQQIKDINEAAYHWLGNHGCDILMNNLSESFNSTILVARDKPIITMCEWIRMYLMNRFATLRDKLKNYKGEVMPKPLKRLD
ncbi:hypothetical protein GmHk_18G052184 [Glycine max]|nr:hypothetical protein GmHk_18G052184 [Glycine max]